MVHRSHAELDDALPEVLAAPGEVGTLTMVVARPGVDAREVLAEAELHPDHGLVGDNWAERPSSRTTDGGPHPDMQLNVISARVAALLAPTEAERALAGDQLHLDLDITEANLPPGTRIEVGAAVIEVTDQPHTGCAKFAARFGDDAWRWVNAGHKDGLRLRGMCAKVVTAGTVRPGDSVRVLR